MAAYTYLITTVILPPKLLGIWPSFFPRSELIFICANLSVFCAVLISHFMSYEFNLQVFINYLYADSQVCFQDGRLSFWASFTLSHMRLLIGLPSSSSIVQGFVTSLASSLATEHVVQHLWKYYCVNVLLEYIFIVDLSLDVLLECFSYATIYH